MHNISETGHMKRSVELAELGAGTKRKVDTLFQKRDLESLIKFSYMFEKHPDKKAQIFLHLTSGYIYELKDELDKALETYQLLFDTEDEIFIENSLKRISSISLRNKNIENALLALQNLTYISPAYLVTYADLLRITGKHEQALNTYIDYLEKVPYDTSILIKTGQYYEELGITDGAVMMFSEVLKKDPKNKTAIAQLKKNKTSP